MMERTVGGSNKTLDGYAEAREQAISQLPVEVQSAGYSVIDLVANLTPNERTQFWTWTETIRGNEQLFRGSDASPPGNTTPMKPKHAVS